MNTTKNFSKQQTGQTGIIALTQAGKKSVDLRFTGQDLSSDAGALLLRETDKQIGLIDQLANSIHDKRDARYTRHELKELLGQRILQICCGSADANDCDALRSDAILKMCNGRLPYEDPDPAGLADHAHHRTRRCAFYLGRADGMVPRRAESYFYHRSEWQ